MVSIIHLRAITKHVEIIRPPRGHFDALLPRLTTRMGASHRVLILFALADCVGCPAFALFLGERFGCTTRERVGLVSVDYVPRPTIGPTNCAAVNGC